jgi:hypothetical protein
MITVSHKFIILLGFLILVGWGLQMDAGPKANTTMKIIDIIMNLIVILWSAIELIKGGSATLFWAFIMYRSVFNITPFIKLMMINYTSKTSMESVQKWMLEARSQYNVMWEKRFKEPCIYIANHALWCLDDFVALGALTRKNLSIVMNAGPSGLTNVPLDCRDYACIIRREEGVKGSGFKAMENIMEEEILKNGKSLIIFPENMKLKTDVNKLAPLRTGSLLLAKKLNIPIVPIWIEWPCQFPTIINSCEKKLVVRESKPIFPQNIPYEDLSNIIMLNIKNL